MRFLPAGSLLPTLLLSLSGCALFFDDQAGSGGGGGAALTSSSTNAGGGGSATTTTGTGTAQGGGGQGGGDPGCDGTPATRGLVRDPTTGLWARTYADAQILDLAQFGQDVYVVGRARAGLPCGVPYLFGTGERLFVGKFNNANELGEKGDLEDVIDLGDAGGDIALSQGPGNREPLVLWSRGGMLCARNVSELSTDLTDDCGTDPLLACETDSGSALHLTAGHSGPRLLAFRPGGAGTLTCTTPSFGAAHPDETVGLSVSGQGVDLRSFGVGLDLVEIAAVDTFDARVVGRCAMDGNVMGSTDCTTESYFHFQQTVSNEVTPSVELLPTPGSALGMDTHGIFPSAYGWAHTTSVGGQRQFTWKRDTDLSSPTPLLVPEPDEESDHAARVTSANYGPGADSLAGQILAGNVGGTIDGVLSCDDRCAFWLRLEPDGVSPSAPDTRVVLQVDETSETCADRAAWATRGAWGGSNHGFLAGGYQCGALESRGNAGIVDFTAETTFRADATPAAFFGRFAAEDVQ